MPPLPETKFARNGLREPARHGALLTRAWHRCKLAKRSLWMRSAGLGQELDDAVGGGARGGVGNGAPGAVERALGDRVLLRHRAQALAVGVDDLPVDADVLLAAA